MKWLDAKHASLLAIAAVAFASHASEIAAAGNDTAALAPPENVGASQRHGDREATWPVSALATSDPRRRYRIVEDCMSFRRFDRLFKAEASNPEYPLNNADALARLPAAEQRLLADRVAHVARRRADCAAWSSSVDDSSARALAYRAALDAATVGDIRAGTCYAMGHWGEPAYLSEGSARFVNAYRTHARYLLAKAIDAGYWPAVIAAHNSARAEHGLQSSVVYSQQEAYVFTRLMERGIGDPELVQAYRAEAERLAPALAAAERAEADTEVAARFAGAFGGRQMTEAERYENCGN